MSEKRYILVSLDDAKLIARLVKEEIAEKESAYSYVHRDIYSQLGPIKHILKRFEDEQGADIEDIVHRLKHVEPCIAAVIEGQLCNDRYVQKIGRRLKRLIDRANYIIPEPPPPPPPDIRRRVIEKQWTRAEAENAQAEYDRKHQHILQGTAAQTLLDMAMKVVAKYDGDILSRELVEKIQIEIDEAVATWKTIPMYQIYATNEIWLKLHTMLFELTSSMEQGGPQMKLFRSPFIQQLLEGSVDRFIVAHDSPWGAYTRQLKYHNEQQKAK